MSLYIGIDLGTTYSAAARQDELGKSTIVHDSRGSNIIPSVVWFEDGDKVTTGEDAKRALGDRQEAVAYRFKRKMGEDWSYNAHGSVYSPTNLSAFVLKKIRQEVESLHGDITEAVVTVPANFANEAREDTMEAAKEAGINVKYIINEPTAAALYYGSQTGAVSGTYVVYDLGGGTFDVSVIRVNGNDVEVVATDGVPELGGYDFDNALSELVFEKYRVITEGGLTVEDFGPNDAEEFKKRLSTRDIVKDRVTGGNGRVSIEIDRRDFEERISKWIAQTEMLCEAVIDEADIELSDINNVVLVGGSTRIPAIVESVQRVFKQKPVTFSNPDEAVALGAALYAAYKSDKKGLNELQRQAVDSIDVSEITGKYFGTTALVTNIAREKQQIQNSIIINKGERIPCSVTKTYYTVYEGQEEVEIDITEANAPETDINFVKVIWDGILSLPKGRPAQQPIEITYSYDANQVIHASFKDVESGRSEEIDISMAGHQSGEIDIEEFTVE